MILNGLDILWNGKRRYTAASHLARTADRNGFHIRARLGICTEAGVGLMVAASAITIAETTYDWGRKQLVQPGISVDQDRQIG